MGLRSTGAFGAVTDVDSTGAAAGAGIREGDVLLEIDRKPVKNAADVARALADVRSALVLVSRDDAQLFVSMRRRE